MSRHFVQAAVLHSKAHGVCDCINGGGLLSWPACCPDQQAVHVRLSPEAALLCASGIDAMLQT